MKKMVLIVICFFALTATLREMGQETTTVEVRVRLVDAGPDATSLFRLYVGFVPDGKSGKPTLGNIRPIEPTAEDETVFEVPPNRIIGIFALSEGVPPFQSTIMSSKGQHLIHEFVLDAGIVHVTTERTPKTGRANVWFLDADGRFDTNDQFVSGAQFIVPAGEQIFQVGRYLEAKRQSIDVVAGQTHQLNMLNELGRLTVNLETSLQFDRLSPKPVLEAENGRQTLHLLGDHFDGARWQLGVYDAKIVLSERFHISTRPTSSDYLRVVIDQAENAMTIPLSLMGVKVEFTGWPDGVPEYSMALIVSVTESGLPFSTYRVTDNRASLLFIPPIESHDYAIALVKGTEVLALQTIDPLSPDHWAAENIASGGDAGLCRQVMLNFDCGQLSR
jgi:hypothetical protein